MRLRLAGEPLSAEKRNNPDCSGRGLKSYAEILGDGGRLCRLANKLINESVLTNYGLHVFFSTRMSHGCPSCFLMEAVHDCQ